MKTYKLRDYVTRQFRQNFWKQLMQQTLVISGHKILNMVLCDNITVPQYGKEMA